MSKEKAIFFEKQANKNMDKHYQIDVRPEDNSLVIAQYNIGSGVHYEIVEYNNRCWVTNLCFPVKPNFWAYVPRECITEAELLNGKE